MMEKKTYDYPFTAIVGQEPMKEAILINLVDPSVGGVLIRGQKGTAKTTAVRAIPGILKDRKVVDAANKRAEETGHTAAAIELPDGTILTGKTSDLMGACSALLIKALKHLAGIDEDVLLITPNVIRPIQKLKVDYLGSRNPRLHMEEVLIALSSSSESNPLADLSLRQLPHLSGSQVHTSRMLSAADEKTFQKLGVMLTSEAK